MKKNSLYVQRYEARHITRIVIKFNRVTDADVIEQIRSEPSMIDYIRRLVRRDINCEDKKYNV